MATLNIIEQAAATTLNGEIELAEEKVMHLVLNEGKKLKPALWLCGLQKYTSKGLYRKQYNKLRRKINAKKKEKEARSNANKCKWVPNCVN